MSLLLNFKKSPILDKVIRLAELRRRRVYLVGGYLRDLFLNRQSLDFDFAVDNATINFAQVLSKKLKSDFVVLDKEHGCARLILKRGAQYHTLDFTDFRGKSIEDDLLRRDFTINAMAVDISKIKKREGIDNVLIDPYSGREDILKKIIKVVNKDTFNDDPLRILRLFSLSSVLKFRLDPDTLKLAEQDKEKLSSVSSERIREELFKILSTPYAANFLKMMDEVSILSKVLPEINIMRNVAQGPYHHLDVLEHSFETLAQIENLFIQLKRNRRITFYLNEVISCSHTRRQLLKLAAFLHDIGKPDTLTLEEGKTKFHGHEHIGRKLVSSISERLKLSVKEKETIKTVVLWHLRPGYLADNETITERAKFRYYRDTQNEGVSILLLSMADQRATRGPLTNEEERKHHEKTCLWLIKEYFRRKEAKKMPKLITGDDLVRKLKLTPGPFFGEILTQIEEEQAAGEINTKKEALELARKIAEKEKRK